VTEYVIKAMLCQVVLFLYYYFFLAKEKMLRFNRYYLVFALFFSVIIPMIKIPVYFPTAVNFSLIIFGDHPLTSKSAEQLPMLEDSVIISNGLSLIYIAVLLLFIFRMIRNLFRINLVAMVYQKTGFEGYEVILTESNILPYSFLQRIFVNKNDYESGKINTELFVHEVVHIQQHHSIDIIFAEIIQALFWFNPILIIHNRAIRLNHEYLADQAVINRQVLLIDYQKILVESVSKDHLMPITSGFSAEWTKKRLKMMSNNRSVLSSSFKALLAVPILLLMAASFMLSREDRQAKYNRELTELFYSYPNFYGTWEGMGRFYNTSLDKEVGAIPFYIYMKPDKTVEGMVGNARLYDIQLFKSGYGIEVHAMLSQPISENEKVKKDRIILLWTLPELEKNKADVGFHLTNNFVFDAFINVGGVIMTKSEPHHEV